MMSPLRLRIQPSFLPQRPQYITSQIFKNKKMSNKADDSKKAEGEQSFSIQPHPAKSNDPSDLTEQTGGLASNPVEGALHARDPHVPSAQIMAGLEEPKSSEELAARKAELNK
ncbi:hypothetical protein FB45DRAFT_955549 [Roridomyces roridus]|uniref:Uncharacterized protein n=1 Tax=Roridomyces roridus TaxID=1738132 RepID=A0AAD7F978_9AGAR|nr:hypothetical protein FB45DRAFT_955549 [Roridomyces roridus]